MLARLWRVLLVFAVLLAQQTALAHDFRHLPNSQGLEQGKSPASKGDKLCDLHDLLGTVLGVAAGAIPTPRFLALSEPDFSAAPVAAPDTAPPSPPSRGPPLTSGAAPPPPPDHQPPTVVP